MKKFCLVLTIAMCFILLLSGCGASEPTGGSSSDGDSTGNNNDVSENVEPAKIGDIIKYGKYEQDNDYSNGDEDVEWIVLDSVDGKLLLMSRYALDSCTYAYDSIGAAWSTSIPCSKMYYMYHRMFTYQEKMYINGDVTYETIDSYQGDKYLFALTSEKVQEYSEKLGEMLSLCYPTKSAIAEGISVSEDHSTYPGCVSWWVESEYAYGAVMLGDSPVGWVPQTLKQEATGVRPFMWLDASYRLAFSEKHTIDSKMVGTWAFVTGGDEHTFAIDKNGVIKLVDGTDTVEYKYECYSSTEIGMLDENGEVGYIFVLEGDKLYRYIEYIRSDDIDYYTKVN